MIFSFKSSPRPQAAAPAKKAQAVGGTCSRRYATAPPVAATGPFFPRVWDPARASGARIWAPGASGSRWSSNRALDNNSSFKPAQGPTRRGQKERESMSSNCQMVNIFAPFHQRINCRAAWGLRCTDHSDPDYPPLESPHGWRQGAGGGSCNSYSPSHFPIKPSGPFGLRAPKEKAAKASRSGFGGGYGLGPAGEEELQPGAKKKGGAGIVINVEEMLRMSVAV